MDIEGYECVRTLALMRVGSLVKVVHDMTNSRFLLPCGRWAVLPQLLANSASSPVQLAVEVHFQTQMPGLSWFGRLKSPAELLALGLRLANAGYVIAQRNDNPSCMTCTELLLVRDPCGERREHGTGLARDEGELNPLYIPGRG